ncbi:MAG: flagellar export chaperone FliS [Nitrospinota bacterium]|nr:flagellar export chaperone FliS [Nitrospinota bacterium]
MAPQTALHRYQANDISTASQGQLILMMYDGALKAVNQSIQCMAQKDIAGQSRHILKTQDIVNELSLALDMERGGEVSKTLQQLYQFVLNQLIQANITSDKMYLESVIKVLSPLREAWSRITETSSETQTIPESSPPTERFAAKC